ncbi:glutathione synthase/RimK-type ligase-like ATP-grasp enzyme [Paenibacillus phyllosphaerae]|uniref:Glutathione synthase/RimK-type ligase-like ATP-grasp enzyme n=1 Tax=Paenibacillus phyllosphaerae TaxID=274593 RepID=A0A7W5ATA9_9BACL|nr:YheC/YheD family protein [Paenibacillus phyllosphaerae]MBB3108277.1 glutathione synthase/RimK-type ligase-like ATP-grasp enzyme [Paenibacillus phyllosphaerae]
MLKSKVAVQVTSSGILPEDTVMLGEAYLKSWKIPQGQPVTLKFGSMRQPVKVVAVEKFDGMRIGQSLARRMGILANCQLRLQYRSDTSSLALGPLIGILISRDDPSMPDKPFGSITLFCKELVDACAVYGAHVYFFTPDHIGSSSNIVEGWVYAGGWRKTFLPAPDVISNRLTSRKLENKPSVQQYLKEVKSRYLTAVFNEKFLDKSEVFEALKKDASVGKYLPESHVLRNYTMLKSMCSKYHTVFLKPVRGSLGKGIIRITRLEQDSYLAHYAMVGGTRKQQFTNLLKLFSSVSGKMKSVRYQIQQGLNLIDIGGRPVDFRALVQKNELGKWVITSIVARTAGSHHFVSNLARGGTLSTVREAVAKSNLSSAQGHDAPGRLQRAALDIANGIDTHIPAHFGELGIDLALDSNGRVWLLEVNSKPSKNDNTPLEGQKIRPSVRNLIRYSRHLSGF